MKDEKVRSLLGSKSLKRLLLPFKKKFNSLNGYEKIENKISLFYGVSNHSLIICSTFISPLQSGGCITI